MIKLDKQPELTAEEIEKYEADPKNRSRGKVQHVRFPSDANPDKPAGFFIVRPNRQLLMAVTDTANADMGKANDMLINGCVLAGDLDQLEYDDDLYLGLLKEITSQVEAKKKL